MTLGKNVEIRLHLVIELFLDALAVQQTLDIRRVSVDPTRHLVIMRDQATAPG